MYLENLGYNDLNRKMYIYDDDMSILEEHFIGECFIDFMELDFSQFESFYDDVKRLFNTSFSPENAKDDRLKISINKKNATSFFEKYPILKRGVIRNVAKTLDSLFPDENHNLDFNHPLLDQYFNFISSPMRIEINNLEAMGMSDEDFLRYDQFMHWLGFSLDSVYELSKQTWNFIYEYENPYISNLSLLIQHPYLALFNGLDSDYSLTKEIYPHILQRYYRDAYIFCFDVDYCPALNSLSAMERLYLFNSLYPENHINYMDISVEYRLNALQNHLMDAPKYPGMNSDSFLDWFSKTSVTNDSIIQIKNMQIQQLQLYPTYKLDNVIGIEFHKMIEHNLKIKKCRNCGQYFILKGDYVTDCCDRIPNGEKFTCKKIVAMKTRKKKVQNNPVLREFEKAYKRMYARLTNHKISNEDFRLWMDEASVNRDSTITEY